MNKYLLLIASALLSIQLFSQTTIKDGDFDDPTVWNTGIVPDGNSNLTIKHTITDPNATFTSCNNSIDIWGVGSLSLSGSFHQTKNIIVNGTMTIGGDYSMDNTTLRIGFSGYTSPKFKVHGSISTSNTSFINNYGTISTGLTNNGDITLKSDSYFTNQVNATMNIGGKLKIETNTGNNSENYGNISITGPFEFNTGGYKNYSGSSLVVSGTGSMLNSNAYFENAGFVEFSQLLTIKNAVVTNKIFGVGGHINAKAGIALQNQGCIEGGSVDYWGSLTSNNGFSSCDLANTTTLPIELLYFSGEGGAQGININWATASEINNKLFTLERSTDGFQYTPLEKISGSGTISTISEYSVTDAFPEIGINYYRLKQSDFDGSVRYLQPIAVNYSSLSVLIYPTVITSDGFVKVKLSENKDVPYIISSSKGEIIAQGICNSISEIDASLFQFGMNTLILETSNKISTIIIKQ